MTFEHNEMMIVKKVRAVKTRHTFDFHHHPILLFTQIQ